MLGISFSFFHLNVTGRKSFIKDNPAVELVISSLYLSSEGAEIEVAPKDIAESFVPSPKQNDKLALPTAPLPITI